MRFLSSSWLAPPVGLDWGSRWGKLVHLRRIGRTFSLGLAMRFCWSTEEAGNKSALLQTVWSNLRLRQKNVFLALGGNTFLSSTEYSYQEQSALRLRQHGGFLATLSDEYSASTVLSDNKGSPRHLRISASREQVEEARQQAGQAGLNIKVVDTKALALCNIYAFSYADQGPKPVYLLHLGQTHSLILFYQAGIPVRLEPLDLTGDVLTSSLAHPPPPEYETAVSLSSGPTAGNKPPLPLKNEIEKIAAFLQDSPLHADTIYLSGGSALFPELLTCLRTYLPLDVQILNCWRGLRIDPNFFDCDYLEATSPQFAVACGMALRAASKPKAGEQA